MATATQQVAEWLVRSAKRVLKHTPLKLKKNLENRIFYAIFHMSRVTNDAYGWKPPPPGDGEQRT